MIFCLRFLNFCVLIALGTYFLASAPHFALRLPGRYAKPSPVFSSLGAGADSDRWMAKLADVKAQIHSDICRHNSFILLRVRDCDPGSDS